MATRRMLSKSISTSEKMEALRVSGGKSGEFYQLLFTWLIPHTDDFGRMQATPFSVKMTVMPASSRSIDEFQEALQSMHNVGLLVLYGDNKEFLQVINFDTFQEGLHKRTNSKYPEPNENDLREIPGNSGKFSANRTELNRTEEKRNKDIPPEEKSSGSVYGEFQNVKLKREEYQKLIDKFGEHKTKEKIENLSSYIASKGKKYHSHYATILSWDKKNGNGHDPPKQKERKIYRATIHNVDRSAAPVALKEIINNLDKTRS